jgi:hypothetical protein
MELSPSREAASSAATHVFLTIYLEPEGLLSRSHEPSTSP